MDIEKILNLLNSFGLQELILSCFGIFIIFWTEKYNALALCMKAHILILFENV